MPVQLKKRVIVTTNPQGDVPEETTKVEASTLKQLFDRLRSTSVAQRDQIVLNGGPAGAFEFEPSPGFYEYLVNYVRRERGVISLTAALSRDATSQTLIVGYDEFELAIAEYSALLEAEHESALQTVQDLGTELVFVQKLSSLVPAA